MKWNVTRASESESENGDHSTARLNIRNQSITSFKYIIIKFIIIVGRKRERDCWSINLSKTVLTSSVALYLLQISKTHYEINQNLVESSQITVRSSYVCVCVFGLVKNHYKFVSSQSWSGKTSHCDRSIGFNFEPRCNSRREVDLSHSLLLVHMQIACLPPSLSLSLCKLAKRSQYLSHKVATQNLI